jgi:hypothetical protein
MNTFYEDRHYPLRDGRWASAVRLVQVAGATRYETDFYPGGKSEGISATEAEALAYNALLASKAAGQL